MKVEDGEKEISKKRIEKSSEVLNQYYRAIFNNTGTATIIVEEDETIVKANREFSRMIGYEIEEIVGKKKWTEFVAEDDLNRMREWHRLRREKPGAAPRNYEFKFINKGNQLRRGYLTVAMIPGTSQSVASILDITDLKKMQEQLKRSEERYRTLFHRIPIGLYRTNPQGEIVEANLSLARMLGYDDAKSIINMNSSDFYNEHQDRELWKKEIKKSGMIKNFEVQLRKKNGELIWVEDNARAYFDEEGELLYYEGSLQDITERKVAEMELKNNEEKYKTVVLHSADNIFLVDVDTRKVLEANPSFLRLLGYESEEVNKLSVFDFFDPEKNNIDSIIREINDKDIEYTWESKFRRRDGETIDVEITANTIDYRNKKVICFVSRDITERKKSEERLKRHATLDELTGVLNRRAGLEFLEEKMEDSRDSNEMMSVCYVDVDGLKDINDTYGHMEGDNTLKYISYLMKDKVRKKDIIMRLGGDEFLLVFPNCHMNECQTVWNRIAEELENNNNLGIRPYTISLSYGFAYYKPDAEINMDELIAIADKNMYKNKAEKTS